MKARAPLRGEDGQIIPPLLVVLLLCMVFGFMMLQVGIAADYKSRAQTAADAGALAGAIEVKREIIAAYAMDHQLQPEEINMPLVCAQAAIYVARNRSTMTFCDHEQYDIRIKVIGNDELEQIGDTEDLKDAQAQAKARATPWSFGSGGGILGAGGGSLPIGGGGGGTLMGANPALKPYVEVAAEQFHLHVSSGLRPISITTNGNHSLHEQGAAVDITGAPADMLAFAKYAAAHWGGQLEELIHTPLGYGVKNGQQVPLSFWGAATNADHFDHVHLADTNPPDADDLNGGPAEPGTGAGGGGGGGGFGGGGGGGFGLGGFGLQVHLVRYDGQGGRVPDIPGAPDDFPDSLRQMFYNLMICESSGNPRAIEEPGGNGGALGHYGLFQFDYPTWQSVGGHGDPRDASPEEQWMRAYMLYQRRGWQPWECATDDSLLNYA
jgi:transglycosylase-like protein/putative Flp pilus-assembly TadE/G-like protein